MENGGRDGELSEEKVIRQSHDTAQVTNQNLNGCDTFIFRCYIHPEFFFISLCQES